MIRLATDTVILNRADILTRLGFRSPEGADVYVALTTGEAVEFHKLDDCCLTIRAVGEAPALGLVA